MASLHLYLIYCLIYLILLNLISFLNAETLLEVIYAVNAGGGAHVDQNGIKYIADPLQNVIGVDSDYGRRLKIQKVNPNDAILYQTERYHDSTFGYDIPIAGDGKYMIIFKFCEVYFEKPNEKVFDVVLNNKYTIISELDIYSLVGKGVAHNEYIEFTISNGNLIYHDEETKLNGDKIRIDFVKGNYDNPKINAFALLKGDVDKIKELELFQENLEIDDDEEEEYEEIIQKPERIRKTSGPKHSDPYISQTSSMLFPIFIAIGAFVPLLFFLCKL